MGVSHGIAEGWEFPLTWLVSWCAPGNPWKALLLFPKGDTCPAVAKRYLFPCQGSLEAQLLLAVSGTGDDSLSACSGQSGRNFLCFEAITPGRVSMCVDAFYSYSSCKKVFSQSRGKPLYLIYLRL